jgi:phosphate transport system permease protein
MTAYIVQISGGEAAQGSFEYKTIFAVGLLLFTMTLGMNIIGRWVISRFRQKYE